MTYVRITDLAATWADYVPPAGAAPAGRLVFVAGPTDEGVRTVEVWADRPADPVAADTPFTVREFDAPIAVLGPGSDDEEMRTW
ncbi:hypothetical protein ACFQV2_13640 [Actinokineospora soli]|uniref:Uncharacterized protein n=1 Tax=Actinokineospora soli TaxID=1048753 RepID=A0ABW2TL73_9PSEU